MTHAPQLHVLTYSRPDFGARGEAQQHKAAWNDLPGVRLQVSWCKLEVKVAGPKAVTALPPQGEHGHQDPAS